MKSQEVLMADPQHQEVLDGLDRLTVRLYRAGIVVAALGLGLASGLQLVGGDAVAQRASWWVVLLGSALAVANVHLYDKRIRWAIVAAGWTGAVAVVGAGLLGGAAHLWVFHAGLGFLFVALSGFALKEQFCFRIPGLRLVPLLLAASLVPMLLGASQVAGILLAPAALLYLVLALAKLRMPLHFDIGDKEKYQV